MTREEILAMQPGRELDALVAEKVMGLDMVGDTLPQLPKYYLPEYERTIFSDVPLYSSDISAAWEVANEVRKTYDNIAIYDTKDGWGCTIAEMIETVGDFEYDSRVYEVSCATAPEAICKSALLAVIDL